MYPSPSSSSSQSSMGTTGLIRFGSAPGSLLTTAVDSVIGANREFSTLGSQTLIGQYFSSDSSSLTSESSCKVNAPPDPNGPKGLQRSLGLNEIDVGDFTTASNLKVDGSSSLIRHSSSPAGFLNHLIADNGLSVTRGVGSYNTSTEGLKSQLSFTRQDSVSQISEVSKNGVEGMSSNNNGHRKAAHSHSYATANSFTMGSWDDTNAIVFSDPQNKRPKNMDHLLNGFNSIETQLSLPQTALEMATMEELLQIHQDSVPCKTRAKRGCATHPRSIAERERRTRISGKLKKLQELVPNMDKQTSYADMLELAVQHIKGLQNQVQMLNKDLESCTCGCRQTTQC